ncbi:NAD(P)-dependent dehydrogenase (short-subunit alcohol dehydrogenase family) [Sphingomonas vulcanisoli]|uniref:NAD(P)-dependent dehydrogenase (Short-subunit alcohol dehydrogenase family) n=1 Tax=Sphingomonas vulcanisoli TaxID=1658060 RepID=A0ABX0TVF3_9SPHN|nr:SDR family NAD(P)-dependent oxidoreductase [Sphingomonas vulcanisoli]NIJ08367.1 NAD(P)-dependent dehydrogenase (short-subunit alcohol dehydrogenase family) [Sphingomonas vulcanisoli]
MTKPLHDRIALVTGASRGIGAATAQALGAQGAHVILVARTSGGLEETEEAIHAAGGTATIAPVDLVDGDSIGRLAAAVQERWGKLDILVLNAAMLGTLTSVAQIDQKEFSRLLTLNVGAPQALLAAFDPLLRAAEHPRVIGLTSSVGSQPRPYWGGYGASKAALEMLLLSYAEELRNLRDLRVAIVDPGATRTAMRALAFPGEDPAKLKGPEIVGEAIARLLIDDFATGRLVRLN